MISYTGESVSLATLSGVSARRVGYAMGGLLVVLSLFPKLTAIFLAVPKPVVSAYLLVAVGMLFVLGIQTAFKGGLDSKATLVVGVSFALGVGLETQTLGADLFGGAWGLLLDNGMFAGALCAVIMAVGLDLLKPGRRPMRLETELSMAALREIDEFVCMLASRIGWNEVSARRLSSASEETLISLLHQHGDRPPGAAPRLIVRARTDDEMVELEFLAVFDAENLADRLAYLSEETPSPAGLSESDIPLRLLRHYACSVQHQKFYGLDVVTVRVGAAGSEGIPDTGRTDPV